MAFMGGSPETDGYVRRATAVGERAHVGAGFARQRSIRDRISSTDMGMVDSSADTLTNDSQGGVTDMLDFICIAPGVCLDSAPLWRMTRLIVSISGHERPPDLPVESDLAIMDPQRPAGL